MLKATKILMVATDLGFILYWIATGLSLFPGDMLFKDYHDPVLMAWNWSFFPLDILVSMTGLWGLILSLKPQTARVALGMQLMVVSLVLTVCSGLMALAFWTIRGDFDPVWWLFNGFLLIYPLPGLVYLLRQPPGAPGGVAGRT